MDRAGNQVKEWGQTKGGHRVNHTWAACSRTSASVHKACNFITCLLFVYSFFFLHTVHVLKEGTYLGREELKEDKEIFPKLHISEKSAHSSKRKFL